MSEEGQPLSRPVISSASPMSVRRLAAAARTAGLRAPIASTVASAVAAAVLVAGVAIAGPARLAAVVASPAEAATAGVTRVDDAAPSPTKPAATPRQQTARPAAPETAAGRAVPAPKPAARPAKPDPAAAAAERGRLVHAVTGFAYQLVNLDLEAAARSPYDMLIIDATTGRGGDGGFTAADIARLKKKPDGGRRLVLSYLSIGEAEDYRPDYFAQEYMTEDAPDWLMNENPQWKGNRIIRFCKEGWQRTVLGDDDGRSLYNSIEPSPLYRLVELGLDGVALDRVDVYGEVGKECPDARNRMIDFVARLAQHARKKNPRFLVLLHNAEELLTDTRMIATIDAAVKEDLFYGAKNSQALNSEGLIKASLGYLNRAKSAGRPVFVIDYLKDRARIADDRRRIEAQGFIPYFGPRKLDALWLPGQHF